MKTNKINNPNLLVKNLRKYINFPKMGLKPDELLNYTHIYKFKVTVCDFKIDKNRINIIILT